MANGFGSFLCCNLLNAHEEQADDQDRQGQSPGTDQGPQAAEESESRGCHPDHQDLHREEQQLSLVGAIHQSIAPAGADRCFGQYPVADATG